MLRKKISKFKSGITLIEILIYVALLTTVLALVTNFLYQVANFRMLNQIQSSLFQNSQLVNNKIEQDLNQATEVITPSEENFTDSLVISNPSGQITYLLDNGVFFKNNKPLTDDFVEVFIDEDMGFRKIGNTVHLIFGLRSAVKPFGQSKKENIYKTAFFINENK